MPVVSRQVHQCHVWRCQEGQVSVHAGIGPLGDDRAVHCAPRLVVDSCRKQGEKAILYINDKQVSTEDKPVDIELKKGEMTAVRHDLIVLDSYTVLHSEEACRCQVSTLFVLSTSATRKRRTASCLQRIGFAGLTRYWLHHRFHPLLNPKLP